MTQIVEIIILLNVYYTLILSIQIFNFVNNYYFMKSSLLNINKNILKIDYVLTCLQRLYKKIRVCNKEKKYTY